jgi:hypothetical protein
VQTLAKPATMYNLTVAQAHTYYVGSGQWLVHNSDPCTHIALGFSSTKNSEGVLDNFASSVNAQKVEDFIGWQQADYPEAFTSLLNNPNTKISINLTGYNGGRITASQMKQLIAQGKNVEDSGFYGFFHNGRGTITSWEMYTISKNPSWLPRITCIFGGKVVRCPF